MSIYVDGERSRQRLGFAKSLLNKLKMLGLNAKTLIWEGYKIKAQIIAPGLDKIQITAPPGAVVCAITGGKYQYWYADQFGGDFRKILERLPSAGVIPSLPFPQEGGDLIFLASADYHQDGYGTLFASWYAPRSTFPTTVTSPNGYLSGAFVRNDSNLSKATGGWAFTQNGMMYGVAAVSPAYLPGGFTGFDIAVLRGGLTFTSGISLPIAGQDLFCRPVFGENEMVMCAVTPSAVANPQIRFFYLQIDKATVAQTTLGYIGGATRAALVGPLGVAGEADVPAALSAWIDAGTWPYYTSTNHGVFSVGVYDVCYWKNSTGLMVSFDGTAVAVALTFPAHDNSVLHARTSELYPGVYCCQLFDYVFDEIQGVFIGSPLTGIWTAIPAFSGVCLRYTPIVIGTTVVHMVILWSAADDETALWVYDPREAVPVWAKRGKLGSGQVSYPWATVFGNHEYARALSNNHYVHEVAT